MLSTMQDFPLTIGMIFRQGCHILSRCDQRIFKCGFELSLDIGVRRQYENGENR